MRKCNIHYRKRVLLIYTLAQCFQQQSWQSSALLQIVLAINLMGFGPFFFNRQNHRKLAKSNMILWVWFVSKMTNMSPPTQSFMSPSHFCYKFLPRAITKTVLQHNYVPEFPLLVVHTSSMAAPQKSLWAILKWLQKGNCLVLPSWLVFGTLVPMFCWVWGKGTHVIQSWVEGRCYLGNNLCQQLMKIHIHDMLSHHIESFIFSQHEHKMKILSWKILYWLSD